MKQTGANSTGSTGRNNSFEKKHNRSTSKNSNNGNSKKLESNSSSASNSSPSNGNAVTSQLNLLNDEELQAHLNDRLLYLIVNSIGSQVNILTNSGTIVKGVLQNVDPKSMKIIVKNDGEGQFTSFNYEDLLEFELENVDLFNNSYVSNKASSGFRTDQDIGFKNSNAPRQEMEKWVPDAALDVSLDQLTFDENDPNGNVKSWDQFETNEVKFGVKSEFDEELYTTKINKNDPNYQKNLEKATKLAAEIESQSYNGNIHLAEERGLKFDDSGVDEEDKYSGVDRSVSVDAKGDALFQSLINKDSKNFQFGDEKSKYVPPSQRSKIQNIDPSIVSATNNGTKPTPAPKQSLPSKPQTQAPAPVSEKIKNDTSVPPKPPVKEVQKPETSSKQEKKSVPEHLKKLNTINEINALKEFSQTFKIPSKFPQDLLPILAKDKSKQEEIIKKQDNSKKDVASSTTSSSNVASPKPKTATPKLSSVAPTKKVYDPAKSQPFKLNPKAAAFTPTTANTTPSTASNVSTPVFNKNSPRLASNQPTPNNYNRKRFNATPASFFGNDRVPSLEKQSKKLYNDFNFFKGCLAEFEKKKSGENAELNKDLKFFLEKPFFTPPTWTKDESEKPYKSFFPALEAIKFQRMMPTPLPPNPMQQFQPIPMMQQPGPFFYPPQPFIPQHQNFIQLSPQAQSPALHSGSISPSNSPFQQQRPMYGQHHHHNYHPAASMPYQPQRYAPNTPIPPPTGYNPNYPPGSSGIPTPGIPMTPINQGPPPPQFQPPSAGSHHQNRGYKHF
ncbi:hypothetical protein WICANDRAFT_92188 [Wickerhamomyces anomalus NRRL Y-366-8]|uniref:Sm domain-containing protein n=1 Tax=Wickerhamomyces anomalus (strain ATCC 58044 / CBS 1984 / NCYC 433 / NRRL Y-366-8) TaxID=683960 RepID=A0A1E3P3K8_WICAA|nr:uncharacterized protein WICANDRAFT_92188 [Wickerhamomyces anomalus NRRL Y-366-8]ODQ60076.1 hypothetical protein WICANDRAFT_92188 [Wickerhamomyces anomalus NRRL Y-366-8]